MAYFNQNFIRKQYWILLMLQLLISAYSSKSIELNADSSFQMTTFLNTEKNLVTTLVHSSKKLGHKKWLSSEKLRNAFVYFYE